MATASTSKKSVVPRTVNPIEFLMQQGRTCPSLAAEWKLKTDTTIHRLRAYGHVPRYSTAERMAVTFGWNSAGEVLDFWSEKVRIEKARAEKRKAS